VPRFITEVSTLSEKSSSELFFFYANITVMIIVAIGLLGLMLGSFVNAFVWRLHEQEAVRAKGKGQSRAAKLRLQALSITKGRSMCPDCHHELAARDLVPVLSWLWLRGKCRYCRKPISWQYPLVELLTAALFILSYLSWPLGFHGVGLFQFTVWLFFLTAFMALAVYDLRWFLLPDRVVLPLVAVSVAETIAVAVWRHSFSALWQPILGTAIIFGLFWGLFQFSKGAWIGGGDVKLALVLGLVAASPLRALLVIFFASLLGTMVSIPLLAKGKEGLKVHIPFGPYLLAATVIVQLYGSHIVSWYQRLLLI
jgi:leader peptidase (prepilin peptidase)/N-methyltransferase